MMKDISMKNIGVLAAKCCKILASVCLLSSSCVGATLVQPAVAIAADGCSNEVLQVRGTPVTVNYCLSGTPQQAPGSELLVPVKATFSAAGGSTTEQSTLHFLAGEGPSRVIESVDLAQLGSSGTL